MAPRQTDPQYKLRMTPEIKSALDTACERSGRSFNAEILFRLEQSLHQEHSQPGVHDLPSGFVDIIEELRASQKRIEALATWQLFDEIQAKFDELQIDPAKKEEFATFLEGVPYFEGIGKHPEIVARRLHQALEREKHREKIKSARGSLTDRIRAELGESEEKPD